MNDKAAAAQYLAKQIQNATPAQQVVMMYDGAIKFLLKAKACIDAGDIEGRYNNNRRANDIIIYMLDTLDKEKGGEIAEKLQAIYMHLIARQLDLDIKNDPAIADDIIYHLRTLRKSWEQIARGDEVQQGKEAPQEGQPAQKPKSAIA